MCVSVLLYPLYCLTLLLFKLWLSLYYIIMKPKTETLTMNQLIELIEANKKKRIKEINQLKKIYYPY